MIHWHILIPSLFFAFLLGAIFSDTLGRKIFVWFATRCDDPLAREAMLEMLDQAAGRVYVVARYHRLRNQSERGITALLTLLQRAHEEGEKDAEAQLKAVTLKKYEKP